MREYFDDPVEQGNVFGMLSKPDEVPVTPVKNEWIVLDNPRRFARRFMFGTSWRRNEFVREILAIEKNTGHNVEVWLSKGVVEIQTYTHNVNDITEIDIEITREIDAAYEDVKNYAFEERGQ